MASRCLAVAVGVLVGFALAVVAPFVVFNLRDTNLLNIR